MAPEGGRTGEEVSTVITCEGTLGHPEFSRQFRTVVDRLNGILGVAVKVRKLEPWNSVRVTLSVPREAALRLRQLAQQGAQQLRALGISSVQLDGEGVVSLRVHGANGEPQEVILRTTQDGGAGGAAAAACAAAVPRDAPAQFKSPNVVCPADSVVPRACVNMGPPPSVTASKSPYAGPFPFASMNQAIHSQSGGGSTGPSRSTTNMDPPPPPFLPPPYPGIRQSPTNNAANVQPAVTISSPLLVNLLQNDQQGGSASAPNAARHARPAPPTKPSGKQKNFVVNASPHQGPILAPPGGVASNHLTTTTTSQANHALANLASNNNLSSSSSNTSPTCALTTTAALADATSLARASTNSSRPIGLFGLAPKAPPTGAFSGHRYQRTPQGSIIAVNKPLSAQNAAAAAVATVAAVPQTVRGTLPLVQAQPASAILLRQKGAFGAHAQKCLVTVGNNNSHVTTVTTHAHSRNGQSAIVAQTRQMGAGLAHSEAVGAQVMGADATHPNVATKKPSLPSPPPYSVAIARNWDALMSGNAAPGLLDLAATTPPPPLTDLKPDELDELLPALDSQDALPVLSELELLGADGDDQSQQPEPAKSANQEGGFGVAAQGRHAQDGRKFLINPLTGELEPRSAGEDSDVDDVKDVFTGLPSPLGLSDDDTNSTSRLDTATDQSDSETRSSSEGRQHSRVKNSKTRREGRDSPAQKEKIKLRLKLEKNDQPINAAYKVDVSFVNAQQPKRASASLTAQPPVSGAAAVTAATTGGGGAAEELRVPPLHISLRGRNSAVIKNKTKVNADGTKKTRKLQNKARKEGATVEQDADAPDHKRIKKFKPNHHEHKDSLTEMAGSPAPPNNSLSKYAATLHDHYKEKQQQQQKERRGSDSELARRKHEANGVLADDKQRRRLSQSEEGDATKRRDAEDERRADDEATTPPPVPGSTNVGTVAVLPQKMRNKDKVKLKERKLFAASKGGGGSPPPRAQSQSQQQAVTLPTAVDLDMEAKFKQGLMEGAAIGDKGIPRPPHRTVELVVGRAHVDGGKTANVGDKVPKTPQEAGGDQTAGGKEKSPEPEKCNLPGLHQERDKQLNSVVVVTSSGGRSPNSGSSGGQGEDSGIESMDALSEKSPNQASQSPRADIIAHNVATPKTQVPDILDIEAQLAKMEGLEPTNQDQSKTAIQTGAVVVQSERKERSNEDVNENECLHRVDSKACCDLTCALQDDKVATPPPGGGGDVTDMAKKDFFTYKDKDSDSPATTEDDEDSNMATLPLLQQATSKNKSLLEQLLIEIPNEATPNLHSPATRSSVRTRALSKLNSPELSSPVPKLTKAALPPTTTAKRKRNESDSGSNHSLEDARKRPRKGSDGSEVGKRLQSAGALKKSTSGKTSTSATSHAHQDESSDSDEPLIEKLRKSGPKSAAVKLVKAGGGTATPSALQTAPPSQLNNKTATNIRRSARAGQQPAQNTRSREKVGQQQPHHHQQAAPQSQQALVDAEAAAAAALRRKTRSADVESKRKKETVK